ncbi:hypothetical protein X474_21955 [Dethiosulfatarculus sandiegensis]|uniref:Uncharacterized protein n=1 Tax=Dethiosulfatarculus sandiegensis TaxID=1429043 RepID=A0A0D2GAL0_9BACT|nr:hypothetical protein X474_21955 [Dethiosulfatarculus sandiegensis]
MVKKIRELFEKCGLTFRCINRPPGYIQITGQL